MLGAGGGPPCVRFADGIRRYAMAKPEFDLAVIGGGAGGLVVAAGGAALGAKVALVEKHKLGGDCLWYGCVPSKTLLKSAHIAHDMRHADRWALTPAPPQPDLARVMARVAGVIEGIEPNDSPERFRGLGVDVVFGDGRFAGPDTFEVDGRRLTAKTFVIATGSRPAVPNDPRPRYDALSHQRDRVRSARAGAVARRRRRRTDRLRDGAGIPPARQRGHGRRHRAADPAARGRRPRRRRVALRSRPRGFAFAWARPSRESPAAKGDVRVTLRTPDGNPLELAGSHLLLAAGRTANVDGLGLEAAGVALERGRIVASEGLRTTNPKIYVIGDAAGGHQFTHRRRAPRRHRPAPGAVPDALGKAVADRALVHVHGSRARARRALRDRGDRARHHASRLPVRVRRDRPRAHREARPRGSPRSSPIRRASSWVPPSSDRTPASSSRNTCSRCRRG